MEVYDNLYKRFNPVKFNADEWVQIAKDAGMKYLVFATKHHDGFCMFDSKLTDYKITNTPFRRDIFGELADACHKAGLKLGFYYSLPDWCHPKTIAPRIIIAISTTCTVKFASFAATTARSISSGGMVLAALPRIGTCTIWSG